MSWTLRTLTNDFLATYKQINPEKKINFNQGLFWIVTIANRLKAQHIAKGTSQAFLNIFPEIELLEATTTTDEVVAGRKYIVIPKSIYDYTEDRGVSYISFGHDSDVCGRPGFTFSKFSRTTAAQAHRLYMRQREIPSLENVYWYRVDDKIYFLGLETFIGTYLEAGLFITFDPLSTIDIDAHFDFPDELIEVLQRRLYDLGKFVLLVPKDYKTDAIPSVETTNAAGQKLSSVNDPLFQ